MLQVFSQRKMVPNVLPKSSERRIESVPSVSAVRQPIPSPAVESGLSCDPALQTAAFLSKLFCLSSRRIFMMMEILAVDVYFSCK